MNQITICGIKFKGKEGLGINIKNLRGNNHLSFSENSQKLSTEKNREIVIMKEPFSLCYCGMIAVGWSSVHGKGNTKYYTTPLCLVHIQHPETVWFLN